MSGLLDILQAASNSAASNVSAPVDVLAWLLRKAGIPVDEPVGGSAWMEKKGLTRPVQQGAANVIGETLGLVSPMAAAAKAPQVAKGLLTMADNAAAPATLSPEAGAIVWHGSPHKFAPTPKNPLGEFDPKKIGTGEGAQYRGHGFYVADAQDVGRLYKEALEAGRGIKNDDVIARVLKDVDGNVPAAIAELERRAKYANIPGGKEQLLGMAEKLRGGFDPRGSLYKIDLADEALPKLLDLDRTLRDQPEIMRKVTEAGLLKNLPAVRKRANPGDYTGDDLQTAFFNDKLASQELRRLGIPGNRFLDGLSRGKGDGTHNYVIFPGEEGLLRILERY